MNAICLVIDRLHVGHLGAYGNSWIDTPSIDRLASRSVVFDQAMIDSPRLELLYRSYWHGLHAMCPSGPAPDRPTLAAMLRNCDINTALMTDDRTVAEHKLAVDFDELIEIDPPGQPQTAEQIEQTHIAKCLARAVGWLESVEQPFLLWCHLAGLGTTWDAPPEFRRAYWEQGDPPTPTTADVPNVMLGEDHDPDCLLGIAQSYAGQVAMTDTCLGAVLEFLDDGPLGKETLLTLTSSRGFPLGEHLRVGACDEALYSELVHVPFMMRFPDALGAAVRSSALVEPTDLWATLLDWFGVEQLPPSPTAYSLMPIIDGSADMVRDRLCIKGIGKEKAISTPAWYLRAALQWELFVKPDDRWDVNDVADRCGEVAEGLADALARYEQMLLDGLIGEELPLREMLVSGFE